MPGTFFFRHWLQRKPLISDSGMHHGTCVTHAPWCMSGSVTHGDRENVLGIPGACATCNFTYLATNQWGDNTIAQVLSKGPWTMWRNESRQSRWTVVVFHTNSQNYVVCLARESFNNLVFWGILKTVKSNAIRHNKDRVYGKWKQKVLKST